MATPLYGQKSRRPVHTGNRRVPGLYERTLAEGRNPYFVDDRHFSAFGTRLVAQHYLGVAARARKPPKGQE